MNIKKRCNKAGCRTLINNIDTYCKGHQTSKHKEYNQMRYRNDREYVSFYSSKAWRDRRYQRLIEDSFMCVRCKDDLDLFTKADMVHHCYNHRDYPEERLNIDTLVSLCNSCHEQIESSRELKYVWTK